MADLFGVGMPAINPTTFLSELSAKLSTKFEIVPQAVAQIPWGHNRVILAKVRKVDAALARQAVKDPYLFDFLELGDNTQEKEIEWKVN